MKKLTILALAALVLAGSNGCGFPEPDGIGRDRTLHAHLTRSGASLRHTPWGPLRLDHALLGTPSLGQPLAIRLRVYASGSAMGISGYAYGHEGLTVQPDEFDLPNLSFGELSELDLTVTPYLTGTLKMSVLVTGTVNNQAQAAQITVPVTVR